MRPRDLTPEQFSGYPPAARELILAHIEALRELPLSILPSMLREAIDYDYKFPAERAAVEKELTHLSALSSAERKAWFQEFEQFSISPQLENFDWISLPAQFTEQLSAYLWSTHQLDKYRNAAIAYGDRLQSVLHSEALPVPRLGIAVFGQGVESYDAMLFRNLRPHGTYFNQVNPENGWDLLLEAVAQRANNHSIPYGHWYIDGGEQTRHDSRLTCVSYKSLESFRNSLLKKMQSEIARPGMGPEELRTYLARLTPADLGMDGASDPILSRFQLKVLTEGSGTQIFSTTFTQWASREALRRAQPVTLIARFAPRQRQRPMNELLSESPAGTGFDRIGSLVDADMAAYYQWINQQRLSGNDRSLFLVWFEGHNQALAIAPTLPRATTSSSVLNLGQLLSLFTA
jgi:hypothetical protein